MAFRTDSPIQADFADKLFNVLKYLDQNRKQYPFTNELLDVSRVITPATNIHQSYPCKKDCINFCGVIIKFFEDNEGLDKTHIKELTIAKEFIKNVSFKDEIRYMTCCHKWPSFKNLDFDIENLVEKIRDDYTDKEKFELCCDIHSASKKCLNYINFNEVNRVISECMECMIKIRNRIYDMALFYKNK